VLFTVRHVVPVEPGFKFVPPNVAVVEAAYVAVPPLFVSTKEPAAHALPVSVVVAEKAA
jgi:hypothetical protein